MQGKLSVQIQTKQEAFTERRHLLVCDLLPSGVTLMTLRRGQESLCYKMLFIVLYFDTKCDVCACNALRDLVLCLLIFCNL